MLWVHFLLPPGQPDFPSSQKQSWGGAVANLCSLGGAIALHGNGVTDECFAPSCECYAPGHTDMSRLPGVTNVESLKLFHLQFAYKVLSFREFKLMSLRSGVKRCIKELASRLRLYGSRQASLQTLIGRFLRNHQSPIVSVTCFLRFLRYC
jgi:hypothetical protein